MVYLMKGRIIRLWSRLTSLWLHKPGGQPEEGGKQPLGGGQCAERMQGGGQQVGAIGRGWQAWDMEKRKRARTRTSSKTEGEW